MKLTNEELAIILVALEDRGNKLTGTKYELNNELIDKISLVLWEQLEDKHAEQV